MQLAKPCPHRWDSCPRSDCNPLGEGYTACAVERSRSQHPCSACGLTMAMHCRNCVRCI